MKCGHALDVIRQELERQRKTAKISIVETKITDNFTVIGVIDLYEVARTIEDVSMERR